MPPPRAPLPLDEEPTFCTLCDQKFLSFEAYHLHKMKSKLHITCDICSADFETTAAAKQHHDLMHPHKQSLNCPGCGKHFTRVGGLMNHIELTECSVLKETDFNKTRKETNEFFANYKNVRAYNEYGRTAGDFGNQPPLPALARALNSPALNNHGAGGAAAAQQLDEDNDSSVGYEEFVTRGQQETVTPTPAAPRFMNDDLLAFDDPSDALNSPWGESVVPAASLAPPPISDKAYPVLGTAGTAAAHRPQTVGVTIPAFTSQSQLDSNAEEFHSAKLGTNTPFPLAVPTEDLPTLVKAGNVKTTPVDEAKDFNPWMTKTSPFLDATPLAAPPVEILEQLTFKREVEEPEVDDPTNPDSRTFDAKTYYNKFLKKYKCPHLGCKKSHESRSAFIAHLKSPAHMNERLQCMSCLRYFGTATALTQHSESQGVRCKVRETVQYDAIVDGITGGTAVLAGYHADNTIKYGINPALLPTASGAQSFVDAHKARADAKAKKREEFWKKNNPTW